MEQGKIIRTRSEITYDYATIKITQSRIDKGLIAIPVPLAEWFPSENKDIQVYLNDSTSTQKKHYSSYISTARECRILGLTDWFRRNNIRTGDEIVIQFIDKQNFIYRLIPEKKFVSKTKELEIDFDNSQTESQAFEDISTLAKWTSSDKDKVIINEYLRLVNTSLEETRPYIKRSSSRAKESVPSNIRALLASIYKGHCQICDFWFLKMDKTPYFETHHLDASRGHHPRNILVVCGNCHNQFEHAHVKQEFNDNLWLTSVSFNTISYPVKQLACSLKPEKYYKELFI